MSFFGKNIKKIRSVKGLSQQAFAELFDLKRGTLGAYEEGRSEPKIETIIKIANYFSIQIDSLLTHELTVNQLLKFKGDLTTIADELKKEQFPSIPCITEANLKEYIAHCDKETFVKDLPTLQLPINSEKTFRAYTVNNLEMTNHNEGFYPKDVVIGEKVPLNAVKKLNTSTPVVVITEKELLFRRLYITKDVLVLKADHKNIDDLTVPLKEVKEVWRVRYVFLKRLPEYSGGLEDKLVLIEKELQKMKRNMNP